MEANRVSQKQLSNLTGYTEKQVSLILNDKSPVTTRFAQAIEKAVDGIKSEFILEYYRNYQEQLKRDKEYLDGNKYQQISKEFDFKKIFKMISADPVEQTQRILEALEINSLVDMPHIIKNQPIYNSAVFSKDASKLTTFDNKLLTIWAKLAMKQIMIGEARKKFVGRNDAISILKENKELLNVTDSFDLITNVKYICDLCGVHVGFSKTAPTTYVRGMSFSLDGQLFIILTDRFKKIEYVVFAFVHEMFHIINGDIGVDSETVRIMDELPNAEDFANVCAKNYLIPDEYYKLIEQKEKYGFSDIFRVAQLSHCSVGLVVSRLQHDKSDYTANWNLLNSFKIDSDIFGNKKITNPIED